MPDQSQFSGRVALQQRVVPDYRAAFFDRLASVCTGGLDVFAGQPRPDEGIVVVDRLAIARMTPARKSAYPPRTFLPVARSPVLRRGWTRPTRTC